LRSQLAEIERENNQLRSEIGVAVGAVVAAESALVATNNKINATLADANSSLSSSHARVIQAYEIQQQVDLTYTRLKNMELANKAIRKCNNTKYYDFEVYRKVRKIVQGMMDNLDFSMISEALIESAVEKEHLEQPNYWLTPLLVAICAWRADEREHAYRALGRAMELDRRKTAAFLMVFNLRLHREEAAFKWFDDLIQRPLIGSDQSVVLLFFSLLANTIEDSVSDAARERVTSYVRGLIRESIEGSSTSRSNAVQRIGASLRTFADDYSFSYPTIVQHVSTSGELKTAIALARNNANIIDFVSATMNVDEALRNEFLKAYADEIVAEPCADEAAVYDEIERNEYIIKYQGDKELAAQAYEEAKAHDKSEFDIVSEMVDWLYTVEGRNEANPQMRKSMMVLTKELQQEAGDEYIDLYRSLFGPVASATVEDYEGPIDMRNPGASNLEIEAFYRAKANEAKAAVKNIGAYVAIGIGLVIAVAAIFAMHIVAVLGIIVLIAGIVMLLVNSSKRKRIELEFEQKIHNVESVFEQIGSEYEQLEVEYREHDSMSAELQNKLAAL
ncbi:MAG: hypothetical protein IJ087_21290, partial [Eggerthellaceae bacterium]|nr:hypothetical protein [Eggerthellaceae bacterium]